ncbi:MAG: MFS transporter, partial [Acidimicrobiales bacterium]
MSSAPERGGLVLAALILVAAVANMNLSVAGVALPTIGRAFGASPNKLHPLSVALFLLLAAPVFSPRAIGDHSR